MQMQKCVSDKGCSRNKNHRQGKFAQRVVAAHLQRAEVSDIFVFVEFALADLAPPVTPRVLLEEASHLAERRDILRLLRGRVHVLLLELQPRRQFSVLRVLRLLLRLRQQSGTAVSVSGLCLGICRAC